MSVVFYVVFPVPCTVLGVMSTQYVFNGKKKHEKITLVVSSLSCIGWKVRAGDQGEGSCDSLGRK